MAYTQNEKITGLDALPSPDAADLVPFGDVSDAGRAKKTTLTQLASTLITLISTSLGGFVQSVTGLNTNNADPKNPVIQISVDGVTITGLGTPGSPLVATAGAGSGGGSGFDGKVKSYSLEGLLGVPILSGYQNIECYITVDGTTINAEFTQDFLQTRNFVTDWAAADEVVSYVVWQGFLFLLLVDNATTAYRVYRYDVTDLSLGGTLMTIAGQAFSTQAGMVMTANDTNFYFNYKGGNSANDYVISRYSISVTTLTYSADITCGAIAHAADLFAVFDDASIYGYDLTTSTFKKFNNVGVLQETFGPYDSSYDNLINWTETLYIVKSTGDDEAYRVQLETDAPGGSGSTKKVGVGSISDVNFFNYQLQFVENITGGTPIWTENGIISRTAAFVQLDIHNGCHIETDVIGYIGDGGFPEFDNTNLVIVQGVVVYDVFSTPQNSGWGVYESGGSLPIWNMGIADTNDASFGFVSDTSGNFFARVSNDTTVTTVMIPSLASKKSVLRIEYDPQNTTPQVRFYVDGAIVATITTSIPTATVAFMAFGLGNGNAAIVGGMQTACCPSFSFEL